MLREYFEGPSGKWAVDALRAYCLPSANGTWPYTGAWFDRVARGTDADTFELGDIVAVKMLSVEVPPQAAIWILNEGSQPLSEGLRDIGADRPIQQAPEDALHKAEIVWRLLKEQRGVGKVIAGKLLAAKRPSLIPIFDQYIAGALHPPPKKFWESMRREMQDAHLLVDAAVKDAGVDVTPLRAADIVLWMHEHGWRSAPKSVCEPPTLE